MTLPERSSSPSPPHFALDPSLALEHPLLKDFLGYWKSKCGSRSMPARADIDPVELGKHLGWIVLTDVVTPSPLRLRFRLIGCEVTRVVGRDSTGKFLDEVYPPDIYESATEAGRWVVEHRRPLRVLGTLKHAYREWIDMESLDLPLSSDCGFVNMIMTRSVFS